MTEAAKCKMCGTQVKSYSAMRKWCFDCRKKVMVDQARIRKTRQKAKAKRNGKK